MNKPNPTLIRQCMAEYANQLGRPHFELARWADIYADLNKVMK